MSSFLKLGIICFYVVNFTIGYENLAVHKPAWQTSNYFPSTNNASAAVNGKRTQILSPSNCAIAAERKSNTWGVDLGKVLSINKIDIYYRFESNNSWDKDFKGRFAGFNLYISNTTNKSEGHLCYNETKAPTPVKNINCTTFGRYVIFYNERKNGASYPDYYSSHIFNELCEVEVFGCGYYGSDCIEPCPQNCKDQKCDVINGVCNSCIDGYQGQTCNQACNLNFYGAGCSMICGNCINGDYCNHIDGDCPNGCAPGWRESTCKTKCNPGTFGPGCNNNCSVNCHRKDASVCDHVTGNCTSGCIDGWKGSHCNEVCDVNFYGPSCSMQCGNCINADNCNHVSGSCPNGCATGWKENTCKTKCDRGTYGSGCNNSCSINCLENDTSLCDHVTGSCTSGCADGWKGSHCNKVCEDHFYGHNCQQKCGSCFDKVKCHHVNGTCINGCAAGWKGTTCDEECDSGMYGFKCNFSCNENCYSNTSQSCNHVTGQCTYDCNPGWQGDMCDTVCDEDLYGDQCAQKCGNCLDREKCHHVNGTCYRGCGAGWKGDTCDDACEKTSYGENCIFNCSSDCENRTCDGVSGICKMKLPLTNTMNAAASIAGGVVGGLLVAAGVVIIIVLLFRRYNGRKPHIEELHNQTDGKERSNLYSNTDSSIKGFSDIYVNVATNDFTEKKDKTSKELDNDYDDEVQETIYANAIMKAISFPDIAVDHLEKLISEKSDDEFESDYKSLPYGETAPCNVGKMEHNLKKNRFKTTFPYDHSRVILKSESNQSDDYINANFIDGMEQENMYIASQGPKPNTIEDFWRMVWQENVTQIIMLTNLKEGPKIKCAQYLPKGKGNLKVGHFDLQKIEENHYAYFVIRKISIQHTMINECRTVTHYHYTAWPDHGVPDPLCIVLFHNQVSKTVTDKTSPVLVHCSAGIGRTGTYIALDTLYKTGLKTGKVNIPKYVMTMRKNRMNMVQTTDQYITIFLALSEVFKAPINVTRTADFVAHFDKMTKDVPTNQSGLMNEFQTLLKIRPKYTEADFKTANQNKVSRDPVSVLPLDRYILYLTTSVPKRGSYINAITVPSFLRLKSFIITPYPTQDTVVDFLRLITDHESRTVVAMDPVNKIECSDMWLPVESENTVNPFNIRTESFSSIDNIETRVVLLSNITTDKQPKTLSVISPKIPISVGKGEDTSTLRGLVSTVMNVGQEPVTVMSSDGASLCGLFCAIFSSIQQMTLDDAVDIFTIVRQLQVRRSEFCSTMDDYYTCYQAIADYLLYTSENLYCNN